MRHGEVDPDLFLFRKRKKVVCSLISRYFDNFQFDIQYKQTA